MLKPDPTRYPSIVQTRSAGPEWVESDSEDSKLGSSDAAVFPGRADLPTDLALDLRLHEILQQARLATGASGAVIALARGDKMICRATLGDKAPSVGVCLNTRSGLAGACVQTREMQLCDDALADPRVNVIACRDLGIRSIVVLPVLDGGELWGVFEVFSAIPRAFSDSDLQALQSISRKISHTVREAIEGGSAGLVLEPFSSPPAKKADSTDEAPIEPEATQAADPQNQTVVDENVAGETVVDQTVAGRDYRTGALTAAVLALAVLLGWMVGRVGWTLAVNRAPAPIPMAQDVAPATAQATPAPRPAPPRQETLEETKGDAKTPPLPVRSTSLPPAVKPASKPKAETARPVELNGGLVVYEHGKVVFRSSPSQPESPSKAEPAVAASDAVQQAAARENDGAGATQPSSPTANNYLLARVEPEYPEAARQQHIEGPVVLDVLVGADGLVRELSVVSGDPQLAKAATDAVRQWRFNPHQLKGKAVESETRITVNFALPK